MIRSNVQMHITAGFATLLLSFGSFAQVIHVDADAPDGGDGTSWQTAYNDLRLALQSAENAQVWIAEGTYTPDAGTGDQAMSFDVPTGAELYGGFNGTETALDQRDPDAHPTVLSGDLEGDDEFGDLLDNAYHVVRILDVANVRLDGLRIRSGRAYGEDIVDQGGGGVLMDQAQAVFFQCDFASNLALDDGGGINARLSKLSIIGGSFTKCESNDEGGGALQITSTNASLTSVSFQENEADLGGAINQVAQGLTLRDCQFAGNISRQGGGGAIRSMGLMMMRECTFTANCAGGLGHAVTTSGGRLFAESCTFQQNGVDDPEPALATSHTDVRLVGCSFIDNHGRGFRRWTALPPVPCVILDCVFVGNTTGLHMEQGGACRIDNCVFDQNQRGATLRGGCEMTNCIFTDNTATVGGALTTARDDGLWPTIRDCEFIGNHATEAGGAASVDGADFVNCLFLANTCGDDEESGGGGAIAVHGFGPRVVNSSFIDNTSLRRGGAFITRIGTESSFVGCEFIGNQAELEGGALAVTNGDLSTDLCTFTQNEASVGGGVWARSPTDAYTASNSIFWANTDSTGNLESAQVSCEDPADCTIDWSLLQGLAGTFEGEGNIDGDPAFASLDDLRLSQGSPCIDAGDSTRIPTDVLDVDGDGDVAELLPLDLDAMTRRRDDPGMADTGIGRPVVDMGAYEFQLVTCLADFDEDGELTVLDFVAFQLAFIAGDPKADFNADGVHNILDFVEFQLAFVAGCPG